MAQARSGGRGLPLPLTLGHFLSIAVTQVSLRLPRPHPHLQFGPVPVPCMGCSRSGLLPGGWGGLAGVLVATGPQSPTGHLMMARKKSANHHDHPTRKSVGCGTESSRMIGTRST